MNETRGLQFQLSPLLLGSLIGGIASTIGVAIFGVMAQRAGGPPPQPGFAPPPPPGTTGLIISVGVFVVAWLGVLVAHARDQVFRRITAAQAGLTTAIEELAERRDTEGYLRGMRAAGGTAEVRPLHRVPPPAPTRE